MPYDYYDYYDYSGVYQMSAGTTIVSLLLAALMIASLWFIYQKAGEPGWAAIVPIYNVYVLFKITWGNGWYFLLMLIPLANFVIMIITYVKLAKAFGKGGGWACGLIFLGMVFFPLTAFMKDIVYVGIPGKTNAYGAPGYGPNGYQQQGYQNPYAQPGYQQPAYQQPAYQPPAYQPPPYQEPNAQQGSYQQPSAQNPEYFYQQNAAPAPSTPKFCPACGAPLDEGSKFCAKCGNSL